MKNKIKIRKLKNSFFTDHQNLVQILHDKDRGYGIVTISYKSIVFGLPLHSNINKKYGFKTGIHEKGTDKGIDYHKAIIIDDPSYLDRTFRIPHTEFNLIVDNSEDIKTDFEYYIAKYIKLYQERKFQQLKREYKKSTLINYHKQLNITSPITFIGLNPTMTQTNF